MSIAAAAIRTAITELLEGTIGTTRTVTANKFKSGAFEGQPIAATQAKTAITTYNHRFDVRILSLRGKHGASPMSIKASHRIERATIEIPLWSHLASTVQDSSRATQREEIENECDMAIQALCYPGNLTQTSAAVTTGIVSGLLVGPDGSGVPTWTVIEENWQRHMLRSVIRASASLIITQAAA